MTFPKSRTKLAALAAWSFVIVNGVTVARRGHPGTQEAGTWVSLRDRPSRAARMTTGSRSGSSATASGSFTEPGRTAPYPQNRPPGRFCIFRPTCPAERKRVLQGLPAGHLWQPQWSQRRVRNAEEATPGKLPCNRIEPCIQSFYAPHCVNRASAERLGLAAQLRRSDDLPPNLERTGCAGAWPHYTCAKERVI
jgi:hypothetical protein